MLQKSPGGGAGTRYTGETVALCSNTGWVDEVDGKSCVVCPYHGWAFDAEGYVRDVPASENKVR